MKPFYKKSLFLIMICVSISGFAYDFEVDGIAYDILSFTELECQVAKKTYQGDIIIPSEVTYQGKTLKVVSLDDDCFEGCKNLLSVVLPNTISTLGDLCFQGCNALNNITLPQGLKSIADAYYGYGCFNGCASLTAVSLPSTLTHLGSYAFANCTALESISLPEALNIGEGCFINCYSLKTLPIIHMSSWPDKLFRNCTGLEYIEIPEGVSELGSMCFEGCVNLSDITVPSSLTCIGQYCFSETAIKDIKLPNITSIPGGLFSNCMNLQSFEIAESVGLIELAGVDWSYNFSPTYVRTPTFWGVPLRRLTIRGDSSTNIIQAGLYRPGVYNDGHLYTEISSNWIGASQEMLDSSWCESLDYLELGRPVDGKLINCPNLQTLIVNYELQSMDGLIEQRMSQLDKLEVLQISSIEPPTFSDNGFSNAQYMNLRVVVPDEALESYRSANVWENFWNLTSKSDYEAGIDNVFSDVKIEIARYDLYGNFVTHDYHGIVIIRYSDGSTIKTLQ